jgi:hypothetical protein
MDFSRFDKYYRYLFVIPLLIALLTYWRFREINLSEVYAYVAQQDVIHPTLQQGLGGVRSIVWDFFGLLNKILIPGSVIILRLVGLLLTVLNYFLLSKLLNDVLGHRFWGFLGAFLVSLSPFVIVAAVTGMPAASDVTITILFLMALYKNQYVFGGILAGVAVAANLPGFIMLLITVLDLLQNSTDKKKIVQRVLVSTAGFLGVAVLVFIYSMFSGAARFPSIPFQEPDIPWPPIVAAPIVFVNVVNIIGVGYLLATKRYDIYRTHFHAFMLWITFDSLCIIQPTTSNFLVALVVSSLLCIFFVQGFTSVWKIKFLSVETFVFLFIVSFLFADIYANNKFLQGELLNSCREKSEEIEQVLSSINPVGENSQIVSNFASSELAAKLLKPVVEIKGEPFPLEGLDVSGGKSIFVVDKTAKGDSLYHGCKLLMSSSYEVGGVNHFVEVIQCERGGK